MSGSRWNVLSIFVLCICQLVTGMSTQTTLVYGNSLSGGQENNTNKFEDQRYDEQTSSDVARIPGRFQDLLSPKGSNNSDTLNGRTQSMPGHRNLSMDVQFLNETDGALDNSNKDNSTFFQPTVVSSPQLSLTDIFSISHEAKTDLEKAAHFKERKPNSDRVDPDHRTTSRQHKLREDTDIQSPVLRYGPREGEISVTPQTQLSDALDASTEPVTSAQLVTSAHLVTSTEFMDAQTEDNGKIQYKDADEEESNETSPCTTCSKSALTEDQVKEIRLNMFKDLLARKLRIDLTDRTMQGALNDGKSRVNPPKLPLAILEQTIKDNVDELEKDQFHARDQEIIIAGEDLRRNCPRSDITGCYMFNLKGKVKSVVAEAQLWFYKLKDANDFRGQLFKVIHLNGSSSRYQPTIAVNKSSIQEGWVKLDITREVHKWLNTGRYMHTLGIRCSTCKAKSYTSLFGVKQGYKPLLVVKYSTNNHGTRGKRSKPPCNPVSECCKRELVVNFHDISMVEVFEPRNLSIGYCYGGCNEAHQFTYNHTALKQRVRLSSTFSPQSTMNEQLKPCCVPLVLKDTFIMATEGGDYVRKIVPKVIVETCGCM